MRQPGREFKLVGGPWAGQKARLGLRDEGRTLTVRVGAQVGYYTTLGLNTQVLQWQEVPQ